MLVVDEDDFPCVAVRSKGVPIRTLHSGRSIVAVASCVSDDGSISKAEGRD
jgi:hypothetical protein